MIIELVVVMKPCYTCNLIKTYQWILSHESGLLLYLSGKSRTVWMEEPGQGAVPPEQTVQLWQERRRWGVCSQQAECAMGGKYIHCSPCKVTQTRVLSCGLRGPCQLETVLRGDQERLASGDGVTWWCESCDDRVTQYHECRRVQ